KRRPVAIIPIGTDSAAMKLAQQLRAAGHYIELGYSGNLKKRMNRADKLGAVAVVILGEDELARGVATLKDLDSGEQKEVSLAAVEDALEGYKK
ncbi:MAG: histidine--tRNA ligase, partial [Alphaproteobacteria bacterium]|nr:histidine--tRNA ligase [Alphaproteobacteria bacterium]